MTLGQTHEEEHDPIAGLDADEVAVLINTAMRSGDVLEAHDLASRAVARAVRSDRIDYFVVRALIELGDFEEALRQFYQLGLNRSEDIDTLSLKGRILKEQAFLMTGERRSEALVMAAQAYSAIYQADDPNSPYYPAVNAASLLYLSGDREAARALAEHLLARPDLAEAGDYWGLATVAEARIVVGDMAGAHRAIEQAAAVPGTSLAGAASTIRQFRRLAECPDIDDAAMGVMMDLLRPPPILVFCGHMFVEGCDAEADLRTRIAAALTECGSSIAYGPLACGADILIAEEVLRRGGELNVVLPFAEDDFLDNSVLPGGAAWYERFDACREAADDVILATEGAYVGDDNQFAYGTRMAMGLAEIRARHLETSAVQIAVVKEDAAQLRKSDVAGTKADIAIWQAMGRKTILVPAGPVDRTLSFPDCSLPDAEDLERGAYSILFADYAGFSKLGERELPVFARKIMGGMGEVLDTFGDAILFRNTWGDALYAVISTPVEAARVALALQEKLSTLPPELGLEDERAGMRIGVHHGPIFRGFDRVVKQPLWFGTEVTRTARIEPVTPTGAVYCTEAFAAMLALEPAEEFLNHYVGKVALAKGYGNLSMYRLSRPG